MGLFDNILNLKPKNKIAEDEPPPKKGIALFFQVFMSEYRELLKLNLIMILFCLPVVTIPAAITAMNKIIMFMFLDKRYSTFSDFFATFKSEWKRSMLAGLIYFPLLALAGFGVYFYLSVMESFLFFSVSALIFSIILIAGFYVFPMIAVVDINLKGVFKNAVMLTLLRLPQNVLALIIIFLLTLVVWMFLPPTLIFVIFIFFALIGFISTFCAYTGLKKFVINDNLSQK